MNIKAVQFLKGNAVRIAIVLVLFATLISPIFTDIRPAYAASNYYLKATGNWTDPNTWSATDGGAGGAGVPVAGDAVYLTANGNGLTLTLDADVACATFTASGASTATLAGTQTITVGGNVTLLATLTVPNTVTWIVTGTGAFAGSTLATLGTVNLTGSSHVVSGAFTAANFTRHPSSHVNTDSLTFTSGTTVTVSGTTTIDGGTRPTQLLVQSSTLGTAATIDCDTWAVTNADFMDITNAGTAQDWSGTGDIGDCGGNTGFTFPDGLTLYYVGAAGNWSDFSHWSTTPDGAGFRVPLPQDSCEIGTGDSVTVNMSRIGKNITFSGTPTVTMGANNYVFGSYTLTSGMTYSHEGGTLYQYGRGAYTLTTAGKSLYQYRIMASGGTVTLQDALTTLSTLRVMLGTFTTNNFDVTTPLMYISEGGLGAIVLNLGSSTITLTSAEAGVSKPLIVTPASVTLNAGTSTIVLTNSGVNAQTFDGAGKVYNNVTVQGAGAYALTITGDNTFGTFKVDDSVANKTIVATGTTQTVNDFQKDNGGTGVTTITNGTWSKHGRLVGVGGTFTGSPVYFDQLQETIICTATGTATITLPYGVTGTATSVAGGATVTDSPKALVSGVNTITVTAGGTNDFTVETTGIDSIPISLNYMSISGSTAQPANVWYAGTVGAGGSTDGGGNTQWLFDDPELSVTSQASTGVTMDKDGVTGGTFNGTINTLLEGTPTITTYFEYGLTAAYGAQTADVIIYEDGAFTGTIPNNLTPGATYHFRAVATNGNAASPFLGADSTFVFTMPTVTSAAVTGNLLYDYIAAIFHGNITNLGTASSVYTYYDYGKTNAYGSTTAQVAANAIGAFTASVPPSIGSGTWHYRAVLNVGGVKSYGADMTFYVIPPAEPYNGVPQLLYLIPFLLIVGLIVSGGIITFHSVQNNVIADFKEMMGGILLIVIGLALTPLVIQVIQSMVAP